MSWLTNNILHDQTFYTDSNGLAMQKRKLNFRPTWDMSQYSNNQNKSSNFYPVNSAIAIYNETTGL